MHGKELEAAILRAIVECLADRVLERLGCRLPASAPVPAPFRSGPGIWRTRVFGRGDAVSCAPGSEVRMDRKTLVTPLAADELARRRVRVVRV